MLIAFVGFPYSPVTWSLLQAFSLCFHQQWFSTTALPQPNFCCFGSVEKFLPSTNQATTTLAVAVIATAGAAATPLILRIVKPIITKIYKTIQKKLGKDVRKLSKSEIETNKYREKKGLPPLKKKN